jgi:miniconductance mechanosensitive channel
MNEIFKIWASSIDWHGKFMELGDLGIKFVIALAVSYVIGKAAGKIMSKIARRSAENDIIPFNKSLLKKDAFKRLAMMFPFIILYITSEFLFSDTPRFLTLLDRLLLSILVSLGLYTFNAFLDALDHYYQDFEVSRKNPIKGYLQMIKIFLAITGIIVIISTLFNKSPWGILSGLGAMTALVILVFRDWILGLVASIQINANNLVVIGDSIEMEKYGVNGEVIDISLSTVKVKNWDNTISMIPAYSLISETFKNWHGVKESGGRRIKRVIYIDINSITLPDDKILKRMQKLKLLKGTEELKDLARTVKHDRGERINKSGITNIGLFRKYVELYLVSHTGINSEKKLMAKLLEPTGNGIPLQIYVFTNIIDVVEYELTVADIFEHLIAVIPEFGLRLFQNPSGGDMGRIR